MLRIEKIYTAAVGATADRRVVSKGAKGKLPKEEIRFYNMLKASTGASTHNPVKVVKNWRRAYIANMERVKMIEQLNAPFKHQSAVRKIITEIFG